MSASTSFAAHALRCGWLTCALLTLGLCSCRSMSQRGCTDPCCAPEQEMRQPLPQRPVPQQVAPQPVAKPPAPSPVAYAGPKSGQNLQAAYDAPPLPSSAYRGVRHEVAQAGAYECECCKKGRSAWPRGMAAQCLEGCAEDCGPECTRMPDEYICDGGDRETHVDILQDWTVRGLDTEDTIAHYDTLQGKTVVEQSNRVCIYAPRFAAVRTIKGLNGHQQSEGTLAASDRLMPHQDDTDWIVTTSVQQQQPIGKLGLKLVNIHEGRQRETLLERVKVPAGLTGDLMPHENFRIIKFGVMQAEEKARLSTAIVNAITWTSDQGAQVLVDGKLPVEASKAVAAREIDVYDFGESRLRIFKTASKQNAKPGEIVDFTLRFDNIGDQTINNVTVIDSLTTRLEYVPDSVQSSVAATFFTEENEGDSLVLRFEITEPVKVGEGGVIRFQARVR